MRELVGDDPVAMERWSILRATFRAMFAFRQAGRRTKRCGSVDRLRIQERPQATGLLRGASDSHLNAFLRGELGEEIVPDFCDTSMFKTIFERAKKTPTRTHSDKLMQLRSLQAVKEMIGKNKLSNKPSSVSRQFRESLSRLMKTLAQATPYFIRCIKSNNEKIPKFFDDNIILRQLRYTGMLETVRIRRAGYSVRIEYKSFVNQYRILLPNGRLSTYEDIEQFINTHPLIDRNNVEFGLTKVFMRDAEKLLLDDHLHRIIIEKIVCIQRWFHAVLARRRFLRFRNGIIRLQVRLS
jgi:myosin-9